MAPCKICGRIPTADISVRRHVGMIVLGKTSSWRGPLFRDDGVHVARGYLAKTLVQGWWGLISVFLNAVAVVTDVVALRKASRLPAPTAAPVEVTAGV